jgi:hypothetical protein
VTAVKREVEEVALKTPSSASEIYKVIATVGVCLTNHSG